MKIETKFNIGDEVYCIIESDWDHSEANLDRGAYSINRIEIFIYIDQESGEVKENIIYRVKPKLYESMGSVHVKEENVFSCYKEAKLAYVNL